MTMPCEAQYPVSGTFGMKAEFLIRYAALAPSVRNTQPWRYEVGPAEIELWADPNRSLPVADSAGREMVMSCGAALLTLRVAAQHFGWRFRVTPQPESRSPYLLAILHFEGETGEISGFDPLFDAIEARHSSRHAFRAEAPTPSMKFRLEAAASFEDADLSFIAPEQHAAVAELVARARELQNADERMRREIAQWLRPNVPSGRDGVPGAAVGYGHVVSLLRPALTKTLGTAPLKPEQDRELFLHSGAAAILWTQEDDLRSWLRAGQALQRILLRATSLGLKSSVLTAVVEDEPVRHQLARLTGIKGFPQAVVRCGYGPKGKPTPRRTTAEFVEYLT